LREPAQQYIDLRCCWFMWLLNLIFREFVVLIFNQLYCMPDENGTETCLNYQNRSSLL